MADLWRVAAAQAALARLLDPDDIGSVHSTLVDAWDLEDPGDLRVDDRGTMWLPSHRWARRFGVHVEDASFDVDVPWLVDEEAALGAPTPVGEHRGTYWERPRSPIVSMTVAPGVRFLVTPMKRRLRVDLELVSAGGLPILLRPGKDAGVDVIQVRPRLSRSFRVERDPAAEELPTTLHRYQGGFSSEVLDRDLPRLLGRARATAGTDLSSDDVEMLLARLAEVQTELRRWRPGAEIPDLPVGCVPAMAKERWRAAEYGDQVSFTLRLAARRARRELDRLRTASNSRAEKVIASYLNRELDQLASGRGRYSACVVSDRQTNRLAQLEVAREHSFIGPLGLEDYKGRLDLRVLPLEWNGDLCPAQTPESTKVGLSRFKALDEGTHAGLSVCAALVPFVNHDDPTRTSIGAKMLKQAVLLDQAEPPLVRTGFESTVAEAIGVVRAPKRGRVTDQTEHSALVDDGLAQYPARFGSPSSIDSPQDDRWRHVAEAGDRVSAGDVIAAAPEVAVEPDGTPCLQLGLNAVVAYLPWHGWNFEDGIVVSESFAARMTSRHRVAVRVPRRREEGSLALVKEVWRPESDDDLLVPAGTPVGVVGGSGRDRQILLHEDARVIPLPEGSTYRFVKVADTEATVTFEVTRELEVGDKLTNRHGGKGVVTRILSDDEMPRLPDGRVVEVLLNPLGVLRRLNVGAVLETNAGLLADLTDGEPVVVPRQLGAAGREDLTARLSAIGCPGGRVPLVDREGNRVGPEDGTLAGRQYLVKLHHLARKKVSSRFDAGPDATSFQVSGSTSWKDGHRRGRPQRMGEMELWALLAIGADEVVHDLVMGRGVGAKALRFPTEPLLAPALRAVTAQLAIAGFELEQDGTHEPRGLRIAYRGHEEQRRGLRNLLDHLAEVDASSNRGLSATVRATGLLRFAQSLPSDGDRAERALAAETARYYVPLPEPIDHPWFARGEEAATVRPQLRSLVLPPAWTLGQAHPDEVGRDHPLSQIRRIVRQVVESGTRRDSATLRADVVTFLGDVVEAEPGSVAATLEGKHALMRRHLLGGAAVRSGRAALVGDPTMDPEEVGLPAAVLRDLGIDEPVHGMDSTDDSNVVLVNRQPTLYPYSILALRARTTASSAVTVHPHVLAAMAGDFDGDTAAVHRPLDPGAASQLWDRCRPAANTRTAANAASIAKLDLDVSLGHAVLAARDPARAEVGSPSPAIGRPGLDTLVAHMAEGFEAASSWSCSVVDLVTEPPGGPDAEAADTDEQVTRILDAEGVAQAALQMAFGAGVAGKSVDLAQLLVRRGEVVTPNMFLDAPPVGDRYLDGLSDGAYFSVAQASVGLLAAKKLITPFAGALTRRLAGLGFDVHVGGEDCGDAQPGDSAGRSPLTCLEDDVCAACYGADLRTGVPPLPGARVGLLAAMLIGEKSTQLAMKSIHQGGRGASLRASIEELEGVFGFRNLEVDGRRTSVAVALEATPAGSPAATLVALAPFLAAFQRLLPDVDVKHAEVLLRRVASAHSRLREQDTTPIRRAALMRAAADRSLVEDLAFGGDLRSLRTVPELVDSTHEPRGGLLQLLVTGGVGVG